MSCLRTKLMNIKIKAIQDIDATNLAQGVVARPSTSEHNMGIAVDLNGVRDDFAIVKNINGLWRTRITMVLF